MKEKNNNKSKKIIIIVLLLILLFGITTVILGVSGIKYNSNKNDLAVHQEVCLKEAKLEEKIEVKFNKNPIEIEEVMTDENVVKKETTKVSKKNLNKVNTVEPVADETTEIAEDEISSEIVDELENEKEETPVEKKIEENNNIDNSEMTELPENSEIKEKNIEETIEENIEDTTEQDNQEEGNPWIGWGLTSTDVKYDTPFSKLNDKIIIRSNGGLYVDFGDEEDRSTEKDIPREYVRSMVLDGTIVVEDNKVSVGGGEVIFEFIKRTEDDKEINEVNLYYGGEFMHTLEEQN